MKDRTLKDTLDALRSSEDPYDRGIARGVEITMKALGQWTYEDNKENSPGALPSNRDSEIITRSL